MTDCCGDCGIELTDDNWWPSWRKSRNIRCIPCGRKRHAKWDTPEKSKDRKLKAAFGITLDDYNKMWTEQNGCCAICKRHDSKFTTKLHVDHCHVTGRVRGLLCSTCNTGIGGLNDSIELLERAISYLEHYEEPEDADL